MKIIALWSNYDVPASEPVSAVPAVCWMSDSCLLREGKPFYVPDFDDDFRLFPSLALRIDRLGKGISERFAGRYWSEVSFWLNARACSMSRKLSEAGLPLAAATAFDCSLVSAPFFGVSPDECRELRFSVVRDGEPVASWEASRLRLQPDAAISALSLSNTLKTGDIILLGFTREGVAVRPGQYIETRLETPTGFRVLTGFKIK